MRPVIINKSGIPFGINGIFVDKVIALRNRGIKSPLVIAGLVGLPASYVSKVLKQEGKRVLDIGPGRRPRSDANIFLDIDHERIKHLPNPVIWDLNKTPYPFEDESLDKIYMESVLEHLEAPTSAIVKELWRVLKYNGKLVLIVPNSYFITKRIMFLFSIMHNNFRPQHRKYLNYSFVLNTAREAGFWVEHEPYKYLPFKNLLLPKIEMTFRKDV